MLSSKTCSVFGYHRLVQKMNARKELTRQLKTRNIQVVGDMKQGWDKFAYRIKNNKKKTIFFALCLGLGYYYNVHEKLYYWYIRQEAVRPRLVRWLLKVDNRIPATRKQQFIDDIKLEAQTKDHLLELYHYYDKRLAFGVGRSFTFYAYEKLGLFEDDKKNKKADKIKGYWASTGYQKPRNQQVAGIVPRDFLRLFFEAYTIAKAKDPQLTQLAFFYRFSDLCAQHESQATKTQNTWIVERDLEYRKVGPNDQKKQQYISQLLSEEGLAKLDMTHIQKKVEENGLIGLGVKDKHQVLTAKLIQLKTERHLLQKKLKNMAKQAKWPKYRLELNKTSTEIEQFEQQNKIYEEQYQKYYGYQMY